MSAPANSATVSASVTAQQADPFLCALIEALLPSTGPALDARERAEVFDEVCEFVHGQVGALPRRLRYLYRFGMFGFRCCVLLRYGRPLCRLASERRRAVVRFWAYGPIPLTRSLFRVVRATAMLSYYENAAVESALALASGERSDVATAMTPAFTQ